MLAGFQPLRRGVGGPKAPDDQSLSEIPIRAPTSMEPEDSVENRCECFKPILTLPSLPQGAFCAALKPNGTWRQT